MQFSVLHSQYYNLQQCWLSHFRPMTVRKCARRLSGVWRTAFGLGIIPLLFILYWRVFRLRESAVWAANQTNRNRGRETGLLFYHFWHRCTASQAVGPQKHPTLYSCLHIFSLQKPQIKNPLSWPFMRAYYFLVGPQRAAQ